MLYHHVHYIYICIYIMVVWTFTVKTKTTLKALKLAGHMRHSSDDGHLTDECGSKVKPLA